MILYILIQSIALATAVAETPTKPAGKSGANGCHAETVTGIAFSGNHAGADVRGQHRPGIMRGVNYKPGAKLSAPAGSNVFVYGHCLGGPTGTGDTKWTDFNKWLPIEKKEVSEMAASCGMHKIFGADMKRWLGPEGLKCAAQHYAAYAKANPHVRVHFECDNMTYAIGAFGGSEVKGYQVFVDELKKAGVCNAAIVPKNLKDEEYKDVRRLDPTLISTVGARETDQKNPPRCQKVGDMLISQNADAETNNYRLDAEVRTCKEEPASQIAANPKGPGSSDAAEPKDKGAPPAVTAAVEPTPPPPPPAEVGVIDAVR